MKHIIFLTLLAFVFGCAAHRSAWQNISRGQSKDEVLTLMGAPDLVQSDDQYEVLVWEADSYTGCGVRFDRSGVVMDKECRTSASGMAKNAEIERRMIQGMQQQQRAPAAAPLKLHRSKRPIQTRCTTQKSGYGYESNCTSEETGSDLSIYDNLGQ